MKKTLAILLVALFVPALAFAAGSGGSANPYHLVCTPISGSGVTPWSLYATSDTMTAFTLRIAAATIFGVPETTVAIPAENIVCPVGAGAFMGLFGTWATADSVRVTPQFSPDGATWFPLAAVDMITAAGVGSTTYPVVEAATVLTTPMWKYLRFIITHYDGSAKATSICSVSIWFARYEKDQ